MSSHKRRCDRVRLVMNVIVVIFFTPVFAYGHTGHGLFQHKPVAHLLFSVEHFGLYVATFLVVLSVYILIFLFRRPKHANERMHA